MTRSLITTPDTSHLKPGTTSNEKHLQSLDSKNRLKIDSNETPASVPPNMPVRSPIFLPDKGKIG
jgi:hypothetical protein